MQTIRFFVKQTPAPPTPTELSYDGANSENFNATDEGFTYEGDPGQKVALTTNSSLLIGWVEESPDEFDSSDSKVNFKNIDLSGSNDFATQLAALPCNWDMSIAKLTGGNIAVVYTDQIGATREVNGAIITSTGTISTGETLINGDTGSSGTNVECIALNNGNFVAVYGNNDSPATYFTIYNSTMGSVAGPTTIDASYEPEHPRGCVLTGGNFVVVYKRNGFGNGTVYAVYQQDGTLVSSVAEVLGGNTDGICNSVTPTDDGGFVVLVALKNGSFDNVLYLRKYNSSGVFQSGITLNDPPTSDPGGGLPYDSWLSVQTFKLDDGNIGIAGWSSGSKTLYCWVYDEDLTEVQSITSLTTITETIQSWRAGRAGSFGDGKYAFVMQRQGPSGRKVYVDVITE